MKVHGTVETCSICGRTGKTVILKGTPYCSNCYAIMRPLIRESTAGCLAWVTEGDKTFVRFVMPSYTKQEKLERVNV